MSGKNLLSSFNQLPPTAKIITVAVVLGGGVFVTYKIWHEAEDFKKRKGERQEDKTSNKALDQLKATGKSPTITEAQAAIMADQLFTACDGYGTDFVAVMKVFVQLKNDADVLEVSKAYGIREVSSGRFNPEPNLKGTLTQTLTSELEDYQKVELAKTLAKKGIIYQI